MVERFAVSAIIAITLVGARGILEWWTSRHRSQLATDLLSQWSEQTPWLILAFSTPECTLCQTSQVPALEQLSHLFQGQVAVQHIDTTTVPELAGRFGIFTVPSTVVLDRSGRVLAINHGLAGVRKLARQLHWRRNRRARDSSTVPEAAD